MDAPVYECVLCKEAKNASGYYFRSTGRRSLHCKVCERAKQAERYASNPDKYKRAVREWRAANLEQVKAMKRAYAESNKDMLKEYKAAWFQANKDRTKEARNAAAASPKNIAKRAEWARNNKTKVREIAKKYRQAHKIDAAAACRKRQAAKLNATPAWATDRAMQQHYMFARYFSDTFGVPFHVDHVVPLQSKLVCGLHTEHNLAVIPATWNHRKSNTVWPGHPNE